MTTDRQLERDNWVFETSSQKGVGQLFLTVPVPSIIKNLKTTLVRSDLRSTYANVQSLLVASSGCIGEKSVRNGPQTE